MWADGRGIEIMLRQGKAAFQSCQSVSKVIELLLGHQINVSQFDQGLQPLIVEQAGLSLVLVQA